MLLASSGLSCTCLGARKAPKSALPVAASQAALCCARHTLPSAPQQASTEQLATSLPLAPCHSSPPHTSPTLHCPRSISRPCSPQAFAFYELGSDLGSSCEVRGNPTEYYRRVGRGSSCGAGFKLGALRAEMIRDNNSGKWDLFLAYGERF
jgi:hypothetical protein